MLALRDLSYISADGLLRREEVAGILARLLDTPRGASAARLGCLVTPLVLAGPRMLARFLDGVSGEVGGEAMIGGS